MAHNTWFSRNKSRLMLAGIIIAALGVLYYLVFVAKVLKILFLTLDYLLNMLL